MIHNFPAILPDENPNPAAARLMQRFWEYLDRGLYPRAYAILLALPDYLPQEEAEAVLGLRKALMERWTPRASAPAKELEVVL